MKRQKRYTDRNAIVRDIDRALRKHAKIMEEAQEEEAMMNFLKEGNILKYKTHEANLDLLLAKAERLKKTRLAKLQNVLAAFDTQPLGLAGAEKSQVVLEKL